MRYQIGTKVPDKHTVFSKVSRKAAFGVITAIIFTAAPITVMADEQAVEQTTETNITAPAAAETPTPAPAPAPATVEQVSPSPSPAPSPAPTPAPVNNEITAVQEANDDDENGTTNTNSSGGSTATADSNLQVGNKVDSQSKSGDARVTENRDAGNATSGKATDTATVLNIANANGAHAGSFQTFSCDITQDLQRNIIIDPATLKPLEECEDGGVRNGTPLQQSDVPPDAGSLQNGSSLVGILNDIILSANSGNASVDNNRDAGNATSGDAAALANIVNIANTAISSQSSFLGVINIYSELKGDILVPQSFVDSLISAGGSGGSSNNTSINNNIDASAASGNASVLNNRDAGNATTGDANTSLTVLNLTGQEVIAKNSLLVFVNVLGKWMGMIVPAPDSRTALLGGGVQGGRGGGEVLGGYGGGDATTNITNNVRVAARSGDANVSDNRDAGNATSGDAKAGVNLLNITDSNFWLQDWFGALFINVLGSWLGDFDIQRNAPTAAGGAGANPGQPIKEVKAYQFTEPTVFRSAPQAADGQLPVGGMGGGEVESAATENDVRTGCPVPIAQTSKVVTAPIEKDSTNWLAAAGFGVAAIALSTLAGTTIRRRATA